MYHSNKKKLSKGDIDLASRFSNSTVLPADLLFDLFKDKNEINNNI